MTRRERHIDELLTYMREVQFPAIRAEYESAVRNRRVHPHHAIQIKNLFENGRTVLDYLAAEIRDRCVSGGPKRFYFPILDNEGQFVQRMAEWFPGLDATYPAVWAYLHGIQPFATKNEPWLPAFNRVNNENKHLDLVAQESREALFDDPKNHELGPVVHRDEEKGVWVAFYFEETGYNAFHLIHSVVVNTRYHADELLSLLP